MSVLNILRSKTNQKLKYLTRTFSFGDTFTILDVGAGNKSASKIKAVFPKCKYYGLDIDKSTNYGDNDFNLMESFYELDLTKLDYTTVPNNHFDYINMSHVIEHLYNGDIVLVELLKKLKNGGHFYIEYPGVKSLKLPSMKGTLNFHDDPTHVRVYSVPEISGILRANGCSVLHGGVRRNWYNIFLIPFKSIGGLVSAGRINANVFWDLLGFAEFVYCRKDRN